MSPETQRAPSSWSVRPETQPACQPTMPEEYENGTDCPRGVRVAWCQAAGPHLGKLIDAPCHLLPASQCVQKRHTGCGAASVEIARACDNLVAFSQTKEFDGGGGQYHCAMSALHEASPTLDSPSIRVLYGDGNSHSQPQRVPRDAQGQWLLHARHMTREGQIGQLLLQEVHLQVGFRARTSENEPRQSSDTMGNNMKAWLLSEERPPGASSVPSCQARQGP